MRLSAAWSDGGLVDVKQVLLKLPNEVSFNDIWHTYQKTITSKLRKRLVARVVDLERRPLISILLIVDQLDLYRLHQTIDSLLAQIYLDWELRIVATKPCEKLLRYSRSDPRIRIEAIQVGDSLSAAINRALDVSSGSLVVILRNNLVLQRHALLRLAESFVKDGAGIIYSDEVFFSDRDKEVLSHHCRPAFSLDFARGYIDDIGLLAIDASLLKGIGGVDESIATLGSYELVLRASEQAKVIVHVPEILVLMRRTEVSPSETETNISLAKTILSGHLRRCNEEAVVLPGVTSQCLDIRYSMQPGLRVAIIIPTKNHGMLVRQCVESIERTVLGVKYDIVIIDHASTDVESLLYFKELAARYLIIRYEGEFNFSSINNWAVTRLPEIYSHYLFCNNDIEAFDSGWLERMMEICQRSDVGIVGSKLLYPGGTLIQHAGVCVGMLGAAEHYAKFMPDRLPDNDPHSGYYGTLVTSRNVSAVTAACALMRCEAFHKIGGFEDALPVGFGDVDLCLRTIEAGYSIIFCPQACLIHHESFTRGKSLADPHPLDTSFFVKKWGQFIADGDPYYNPNLSIYSTQWDANFLNVFKLDVGRRVVRRSSLGSFTSVAVSY